MSPSPDDAFPLRDAVCAGCGLLCDDIELRLESGRIAASANACEPGRSWLASRGPLAIAALVEGAAASPAAAAAAAAAALSRSAAPAFLGFHGLTLEAAREAVLLAEALPAPCLPWPPALPGLRRSGLDVPEAAATWGELRATADLVVFWRCDPLRSHPRHLERISLEPPLLTGAGRAIAVVEEAGAASATAARARARVAVASGEDLPLARRLRLALESPAGDGGEPPLAGSGAALLDLLLASRHAHFVVGEAALGTSALWDELQLLAARARSVRRITVSALPAAGNHRGILELVTWRQGGAPAPLDAERWLAAGAADLHILAGLTAAELPEALRGALRRAPWISIGSELDQGAVVSLRIPGLDPRLRATVVRADGIHLTLDGRSGGPGEPDPAAAWLAGLRGRLGEPLAARGRAPCAS